MVAWGSEGGDDGVHGEDIGLIWCVMYVMKVKM